MKTFSASVTNFTVLLPQSHDCSSYVSRRMLGPPPLWVQKYINIYIYIYVYYIYIIEVVTTINFTDNEKLREYFKLCSDTGHCYRPCIIHIIKFKSWQQRTIHHKCLPRLITVADLQMYWNKKQRKKNERFDGKKTEDCKSRTAYIVNLWLVIWKR